MSVLLRTRRSRPPFYLGFRFGGRDLIKNGNFARASVGAFFGFNQLVQLAGSGVAREANYIAGGSATLFMEGQRTNIIVRSEEFDNASWTKTRSSINTANAIAAPDGTVTADRLQEDATAANSHFMSQTVTVTGSVDHSLSVFLKADQRNWCYLQIGLTNLVRQWFNLNTGAIGSNAVGGTGVFRRALITPLPGGWFRCQLVGFSGTGTSAQFHIGLSTGDGVLTYNGDNASGMYAWGAQLEQNVPMPSSYIPTVSASATRVADVLDFPIPPSLADPQAMTMYAAFRDQGTFLTTTTLQRILQIGATGGGTPLITMGLNDTIYRTQFNNPSGVFSDVTVASIAPAFNDLIEMLGQFYPDGSVQMHVSKNGGATVSGTRSAGQATPAWSSPTRVNINQINNGATPSFVMYRALKLYPGVHSMNFMRGL